VQSREVVRGNDRVIKKDLLDYISDSVAQDDKQTPYGKASTKTAKAL